MELEELTKTWKATTSNTNENKDMMQIIHQKGSTQFATLKAVFRKQILMMAILPVVLILSNFNHVERVLTSIMFWSYVTFCICMIAFASYNYKIVRKIERMDVMVLESLKQQVNILERRAKLEILGLRMVMLFFILLTEIVPYIQHYRMLDKWHSLPVYTRFAAYASLLVLQYFLSRRVKQQRVGRHLDYLKTLINDLEGHQREPIA